MARPTKLTPQVHTRICELLRAGNYLTTSAAACGVTDWTVNEWVKRGRRAAEGDDIYIAFAEDVDKAKAESEAIAVSVINKAAKDGDWRAMAWRLERTQPEKFAPHAYVTARVDHELQAALERIRDVLPASEFERVLAALASPDGADCFALPAGDEDTEDPRH